MYVGQNAYRSVCEFRMREVLGSCLYLFSVCEYVSLTPTSMKVLAPWAQAS